MAIIHNKSSLLILKIIDQQLLSLTVINYHINLKMKGVTINNKGAKIHFTRHALSQANTGLLSIDSPLSQEGIKQAKLLIGDFDCVVLSPLRRTQETLHYSQIKYGYLHICPNFRERVFNESDRLMFENPVDESDEAFNKRIKRFHQELEELCETYKNILLIGHAYFYNSWYRRGCFPSPANAQIIQLLC